VSDTWSLAIYGFFLPNSAPKARYQGSLGQATGPLSARRAALGKPEKGLALKARQKHNRFASEPQSMARQASARPTIGACQTDHIFYFKPWISELWHAGYPSVALSALAFLFMFT